MGFRGYVQNKYFFVLLFPIRVKTIPFVQQIDILREKPLQLMQMEFTCWLVKIALVQENSAKRLWREMTECHQPEILLQCWPSSVSSLAHSFHILCTGIPSGLNYGMPLLCNTTIELFINFARFHVGVRSTYAHCYTFCGIRLLWAAHPACYRWKNEHSWKKFSFWSYKLVSLLLYLCMEGEFGTFLNTSSIYFGTLDEGWLQSSL